ncbi:family 16 glycoside hydrolase [Sphingobacterium corticis]|uniref:Family 16 glycoside hydrolase n=1 Tax=Sphingobacterium corticis TaxID=1812823 RepID=A0ABW5NLR6_9SPHI
MKKILYTLVALALCQSTANAQLSANRSTATKIADLLAKQPAENSNSFSEAMQELEQFDAKDVKELALSLEQNPKNTAPLTYALNSYAYYAMQSDKRKMREVYVDGLCQAIEAMKSRNSKAFVLELLKKVGSEDAIPIMASYLSNDELVSDAAIALSAIGGQESIDVLLSALENSSSEKQSAAVVTALGELKAQGAEMAILNSLERYTNAAHQRNAFHALGRISGKKSGPFMLDKSNEIAFAYEATNASSISLDYAENRFASGDKKQALEIVEALLKTPITSENVALRGRALGLLAEIDVKKTNRQLLEATKSEHANYRQIALKLLEKYGSKKDWQRLIQNLPNASNETQESVFNFWTEQKDGKYVNEVEKILPHIKESRPRIAALRLLSSTTNKSVAKDLIQEIAKAGSEEKVLIKRVLLSSKESNITNIVNESLADSEAQTQIVLLAFLLERSNEKSFTAVSPLLRSPDTQVKKQAYQTLSKLVANQDIETLISLLDETDSENLPYLQKALISAAGSGNAQTLGKIKAELEKSDDKKSAKLLPVLAGIGEKSTLFIAKSYLDNSSTKTAAINALSNWSTEDALPELITLSRSEKGENLSIVVDGLIKQISKSAITPEQKTLHLKDVFVLAQDTKQKQQVLQALQNAGTFQAFLFCAKFLDDASLKRQANSSTINIALDHPEYTGAIVSNVLQKAMANMTKDEGAYLQAALERHLEKITNNEGFVALFNDQDLSGWKGLVADPIKRKTMSHAELVNAQAKAEQAMRTNWSVENGTLVFGGKGDNIVTEKHYGDFEMLVDWKLDPNGEEPDAGIYLRGTPQVQIWDISRTNVGAQVGSGGLYNNKTNPSNPLKVADNALGEWNTFKIRMIGEHVSVWLNGQLVVDSTVLENYWDRDQPIFPSEQIELQAHGSKVWYRDIFIKELGNKQIFELSADEQQDGFEMLFDGSNLDKWTESTAYEITPQGHLRANPNAKFGKNLFTQETFSDFVYRFDFKLTPGANNGVGIRAPLEGDAAYVGTEIQILDNDADVYKNLEKHQYHGSAYGVMAAKREALKSAGEWNSQEIRVQGDHVKVTLNGTVILDGNLTEASKNGTLDGKDHPGLSRKSGHIGFLGHDSEVFFRNIRIKKL